MTNDLTPRDPQTSIRKVILRLEAQRKRKPIPGAWTPADHAVVVRVANQLRRMQKATA